MRFKDLIPEKEINRSQYLGLLLAFVIITFLITISSLMMLELSKNDINIKYFIYFLGFIYALYIIFLGYRRYIDITNKMLFFPFYILGILMVFFGWGYTGIYTLTGFIPIILLSIIPGKNTNFFDMSEKDFIESINFYKKYDYKLRNLFTIRILLVSLVFYFLVNGLLNDYLYNLKNYLKEPIEVLNNVDNLDEKYVKFNTKGLNFNSISRGLFENISKDIKLKNGEKAIKKNYSEEIFTFHPDFGKITIHTNNYEKTRKILNGDISLVYGKMIKNRRGYSLHIGKNYAPEKVGFGSILFFFFTVCLYFFILFKDIATLKSREIEMVDFDNFIKSNNYKEILKNIKLKNNSSTYKYALITKIAGESFGKYKEDLYFLKGINYDDEDIMETLQINLKEDIINLKENEIVKFFEDEKYKISLIFAYIFKKILGNKENISSIINENNDRIEQLERVLNFEKGKGYVRRVKKDSEIIYNDLIKEIISVLQFDTNLMLFEEGKQKFITFIIYSIVLIKFIKKENDIVVSIFNLINPLGFIAGKIFKN